MGGHLLARLGRLFLASLLGVDVGSDFRFPAAAGVDC